MEVRNQAHAPAASSRINAPSGALSVGGSVGPRNSMDALGREDREKRNISSSYVSFSPLSSQWRPALNIEIVKRSSECPTGNLLGPQFRKVFVWWQRSSLPSRKKPSSEETCTYEEFVMKAKCEHVKLIWTTPRTSVSWQRDCRIVARYPEKGSNSNVVSFLSSRYTASNSRRL